VSARAVRLVFLNGPEDGKELTRLLPLVFGRLIESDIPIPYDALASRKHARLSFEGDAVVLEDLGSSNGTFLLTGQPVLAPTPIGENTIFRVGGVWMRLTGVSAET
jgi:pSer/pThr/pTyr-binding forkhead associated (FHA) protein